MTVVPRELPGSGLRTTGWVQATALVLMTGAVAHAEGHFRETGRLSVRRAEATLTVLRDGRALLVGGADAVDATAELYDPAAGRWSRTAAPPGPRTRHTATLLDDGRVLVVGGWASGALTSAWLFHPATETWAPTGSLRLARYDHTAALLADGRVVVAGGAGGHEGTAELYDPGTGRWSETGPLICPRSRHRSVVLKDGRVLVAGGVGSGEAPRTAEVYEPRSGTWSPTGALGDEHGQGFSLTLLEDGRVLIAGGADAGRTVRAEAELYDPETGRWTPTAAMPAARASHAATLRPDGMVLVTGGQGVEECQATALTFDPDAEAWWTVEGPARVSPESVRLQDGRVLVAAGRPDERCPVDLTGGRASFLFGDEAAAAPDLVVTHLFLTFGDASPGELVPLVDSAKNVGDLSTGAFRVGYYFSRDDLCTPGDTLMGSRDVGPLGPGATDTATTLVTVPPDAPLGPGSYVCAIADDLLQEAESDEDNNTRLITIFIVSQTPVVTLWVNGLHPESRLVVTPGPVKVTLEVSPYTSYEASLDWYWAFFVGTRLYWVTPTGVSTTPAPLLRSQPFGVRATLFDLTLPPGSTLTNVFFLWNGGVVSYDWITAAVATGP
ncbi:MAG TPA: kelch repeat-containing protein [Vicinamibacteria bacterium]